MSAKYTDLSTSYPDQIQTFVQMKDITEADAPLVKQYHDAIISQNFPLAFSVWKQISQASQKFLTATILNTAFDTEVALEREFLERWSPAYVVSNTQPLAQETGDFWFDTGVVTY